MAFKNISHWIIFPWLIASYPVLFLYAQNFSLVIDSEALGVLALTLALTTVVFAVVRIVARDNYKGACLTSLVAIVFFLYGHLVNVILPNEDVSGPVLLPAIRIAVFVVSVLILIVGFILVFRMKTTQKLYSVTPYLNFISAVLVFFVLVQIAGGYFKVQDARAALQIEKPARDAILNNSPENPDIYYIILDGYPSNDYFLREFGYDNSDFTDALEERGFFVAYDSLSNYGATLGSLPSSLNMRYLTEDDRLFSADSVAYARWLLANNKTAYDLQERGYEYIFMLSGFVSPSDIADINIDFYPRGPHYIETDGVQDNSWYYKQPFWPLLVKTTMAYPLEDRLVTNGDDRRYGWYDEPQRILAIFDEAEKIPLREEATFSFIHIIKPHEPVSFDKHGNIIKRLPTQRDNFFAQLEFINRRTLQMIDSILAQSSVPPIVIIQGDHGSRLGDARRGSRDMTFFEILNAYHFPNGGEKVLSSSITPVNTFRVMFNYYFGTDYELLEDHFYNMPDEYDELFNLIEVDIDAWRRSWKK